MDIPKHLVKYNIMRIKTGRKNNKTINLPDLFSIKVLLEKLR